MHYSEKKYLLHPLRLTCCRPVIKPCLDKQQECNWTLTGRRWDAGKTEPQISSESDCPLLRAEGASEGAYSWGHFTANRSYLLWIHCNTWMELLTVNSLYMFSFTTEFAKCIPSLLGVWQVLRENIFKLSSRRLGNKATRKHAEEQLIANNLAYTV